jgi:hypothetical protein
VKCELAADAGALAGAERLVGVRISPVRPLRQEPVGVELRCIFALGGRVPMHQGQHSTIAQSSGRIGHRSPMVVVSRGRGHLILISDFFDIINSLHIAA